MMSTCARLLKFEGILIISVPVKGSFVRTIQKIFRNIGSFFGVNVFPYLEYSIFELDIENTSNWLNGFGFSLVSTTKFDPLLKANFLRFFRPALLIIVAKKALK